MEGAFREAAFEGSKAAKPLHPWERGVFGKIFGRPNSKPIVPLVERFAGEASSSSVQLTE